MDKEYFLAPYRVTAFHDTLYVVGRLVTADGVAEPINDHNNTFLLHRFKKAEITHRNTDLAPLVANQSEGAFGWYDSGSVFESRIKFVKATAPYVTTRTWSGNQKIEYLENGDFILTMKVRSKNELVSWIMSFSGAAEVLEQTNTQLLLKFHVAKMSLNAKLSPDWKNLMTTRFLLFISRNTPDLTLHIYPA